MAEVDTSIYPKASQNSLLDIYGGVAQLRNALVQNQRQQVGLQQDKIDYAHKQFEGFLGLIGSLAQRPDINTPAGMEAVKQGTAQAVNMGYLTPDMAGKALSTMPTDSSQISQWLQTQNTMALNGLERFGATYGQPSTINNGNSITPITVSPITGVRQIAAPIPVQTSPSERAALVPGTNAQGQSTLTPAGVVLQNAGVNPLTAIPNSAPQGPANQLVPAQGGAGGQATGAQPAGGNSVVTGPPAGTVEAQRAVGEAGGQQLAADTARERNFQADIIPLQKARDALVKLGPTGTGPGTEQINEVKSFLTSMGIIGPNDDVKSFDEARKYLTQYASQAGNPNTNDKLAAAFAGNPNVGISNAASVDVLKTALSLRRLQNAQVTAFNQSGQAPASYNQWTAQFNSSQDPVAYGFDMLSAPERQKYVKGLSAPERQKFVNSLHVATQLGLVTPPAGK